MYAGSPSDWSLTTTPNPGTPSWAASPERVTASSAGRLRVRDQHVELPGPAELLGAAEVERSVHADLPIRCGAPDCADRVDCGDRVDCADRVACGDRVDCAGCGDGVA